VTSAGTTAAACFVALSPGKRPRSIAVRSTARSSCRRRGRRRIEELLRSGIASALAPQSSGGALIIPGGIASAADGVHIVSDALSWRNTARRSLCDGGCRWRLSAVWAMSRVDVERWRKLGTSSLRVPATGRLRSIEVKGRIRGADTVTGHQERDPHRLNRPDDWFLALVDTANGCGK